MSFKKSYVRHSISPLQIHLLSILDDWERTDASWKHIVNEMKKRRYYKRLHLGKLWNELNDLVDMGLVAKKEYRDGTIHFILREYFYE